MNATLTPRPKTQKVLRHLMEQQQALEIGERIRQLREDSAETNRSIADYCDVGERSVAAWVAGEGIAYKNAKKVAELFEVSIDWIWRGREPRKEGSPLDALSEPASTADLAEQVRETNSELAEVRGELSAVRTELQRVLSLLQPAERDQEELGE